MRRSPISLQMSGWSHVVLQTLSCREQMNESEAPYQAAETFRVSLLTSQTLSWFIYDLNVTPLKLDTEK